MVDYSKVAFISLGSNLGDSKSIIIGAIEELKPLSVDGTILKSSLWQTTPVDCPPGSPLFINAVVGIFPREDETPESLLEKLQSMEKVFGRKPKIVLNEPRPLDLDLITFGYEVRNTNTLILPHPRATKRAFVLAPMNEIAPEFIFPLQSKTVSELLKNIPMEGVKKLE